MNNINRSALRNRRIALKITIDQVAKAMHVCASYISRWERGIYINTYVNPHFAENYQQFLDDCENGKVSYVKSPRAGNSAFIEPAATVQSQLELPIQEEHEKTEQKKSDTQINHPNYYCSKGFEVIDFIDAHRLNFNLGNVVKYVSRAGKKDSEDTLTALKKARWYLEREISHISQKGEIKP